MDTRDEKLEGLLRIVEPPIADDGFSEAVLARLPPTKRLSARTARCLSLAAAACIGSLVTLVAGPPEILPLDLLPAALAEPDGIAATLLRAVAMAALLTVPAAWLLYAEMVEHVPESAAAKKIARIR